MVVLYKNRFDFFGVSLVKAKCLARARNNCSLEVDPFTESKEQVNLQAGLTSGRPMHTGQLCILGSTWPTGVPLGGIISRMYYLSK